MKIVIDGQTLSTPERNRGIGVVLINLCERLIANQVGIQWYMTVADPCDLNCFSKVVQARIVPLKTDFAHTDFGVEADRQYTQFLQTHIDQLGIDIYWNPNPLMLNVCLPEKIDGCKCFATIHDLIPIVMSRVYLKKWPRSHREAYQNRVERLPWQMDGLIFVSKASMTDYSRLNDDIVKVGSVIYNAVDHARFWPFDRIVPLSSDPDPYVLFIGGFDPRKNMEKAVAAFAELVRTDSDSFDRLRFVVVCAYEEEEKERFLRMADKLGVIDRVSLKNNVDDDALAHLYRHARLFFFPSLYEGFGLPILEAMASGIPVVTTDRGALPEIGANAVRYCSPENASQMAAEMESAIKAVDTSTAGKIDGLAQAGRFHWNKSAKQYADLFMSAQLGSGADSHGRKLQVGYVTPWPPQRSGIANHNFELVRRLHQTLRLTLYLEKGAAHIHNPEGLQVKKLTDLPSDYDNLDLVIYHIGNNVAFHKRIYQLAWSHPGLVVLHDVNIHQFLYEGFFNTAKENYYRSALLEGYGETGRKYYEDIKQIRTFHDIWKFPMSHALAKRSKGMIVHSFWALQQFEGIDNVFVVPLAANTPERSSDIETRAQLYDRLGLDENSFLVASIGFVNKLKRIHKVLEALKILIERGYPIQFVLCGQLTDPGFDFDERCRSLGIESRVIKTGYLDDRDFKTILQNCDVVVNLRCPSMGESSAALMDAFAYGNACIVSNYNQYGEIPDTVCWKADVDHKEISQLVAFLEVLLRDPGVKRQLGQNAYEFVRDYASFELAANYYQDIISRLCA
jgi:glycosyltransferase involved in cell wall biosynthesis